jgi:hypothetical protein
MASSYNSSSNSDFEGFTDRDIAQATQRQLEKDTEHPDDSSDIDFSDSEPDSMDTDQDSDNESGTHMASPPAECRNPGSYRVTVHPFTSPVGPTSVLGCEKEIDFLDLMLPEEFYQDIAIETNRYARESMRRKQVRDLRWRETTAEEIRAFLGVHMVMGIVTTPNQDMYFSKDPLYSYVQNTNLLLNPSC